MSEYKEQAERLRKQTTSPCCQNAADSIEQLLAEVRTIRAHGEELRQDCIRRDDNIQQLGSDIASLTSEQDSQAARVEVLTGALQRITDHFAAMVGGPMIAGSGITFANGVEGIPTIANARAILQPSNPQANQDGIPADYNSKSAATYDVDRPHMGWEKT